MRRYLPLLAWLVAVALPSTAVTQPVGPEFQVNTFTRSSQQRPSVAAAATGGFIVVWESYDQDGGGGGNFHNWGVFGQRFDGGGHLLGPEFQANTFTTSRQSSPDVSSDSNGNFVVVWHSYRQEGIASYGIFGQRYDNDGNPLGGEFHVNTFTPDDQHFPSVAVASNSNFVVAWQSGRQDGGSLGGAGVFGQRYDSAGKRLGEEFQINTNTAGNQTDPDVSSDASGNFVVVWVDGTRDGEDGSGTGIFGQRYDSSGNRLGSEFQVNSYTTDNQHYPSVASDADGHFVVVWQSDNQDGDSGGIFGQRYDNDGIPLGGEFQVNTYTTERQRFPSLSSDASGNFVVVWESDTQDDAIGADWAVFGQRYDSGGHSVGGEFQVNTYTSYLQQYPSIASDARGNFIAVWESLAQDGSSWGVFGQRFSAGCEASVQVQGDGNTAGTIVPVQVYIAHHRPKTVTVRWKLSLLDGSGQAIAEHISPPHTFKPGDVLDQEVKFQLPDDLASGEYTLDLAIKQMAGTKGATTTLRVVRAE